MIEHKIKYENDYLCIKVHIQAGKQTEISSPDILVFNHKGIL